jgi:hypothetical protein
MPPPGAGTVASLPILAHKSNSPIQSFAAGSAQHDITRYEHTFQRPGSIQSSWWRSSRRGPSSLAAEPPLPGKARAVRPCVAERHFAVRCGGTPWIAAAPKRRLRHASPRFRGPEAQPNL